MHRKVGAAGGKGISKLSIRCLSFGRANGRLIEIERHQVVQTCNMSWQLRFCCPRFLQHQELQLAHVPCPVLMGLAFA